MKKTLPLLVRLSLGLGLTLSAASLVSAQETVPDPILFYNFNSADGYAVKSTGSAEMDLDMYRYSSTEGGGIYANRLGTSGSGTSGASGDRALNLSNATQMGGSNGLGGGAVGGSLTDFDGAKSLTIAGWFNATGSSITTNAHLINALAGNSSEGFRLAGTSNSSLQLTIIGANGRGDFTSSASYGDVGSWVFFAVTFDSSSDGNSVINFYMGGIDSGVELLTSSGTTADLGNFKAGTRNLTIGNVSANDGSLGTNRPFQGYIDNIGLWGSAEDGSGALTLQQLEGLRVQQVIPEPSVAASLFGIIALLACLKMVFKKKLK